jgi:hypothetical protein
MKTFNKYRKWKVWLNFILSIIFLLLALALSALTFAFNTQDYTLKFYMVKKSVLLISTIALSIFLIMYGFFLVWYFLKKIYYPYSNNTIFKSIAIPSVLIIIFTVCLATFFVLNYILLLLVILIIVVNLI